MFTNLNARAIGIKDLPLAETIALAASTEFEGVDFSIVEAATLADKHGNTHVQALFELVEIRPGAWSLPVNWNESEAQFRKDLAQLPGHARLARRLGSDRAVAVLRPGSNDFTYTQNFDRNVTRLQEIAAVLADSDCRLGFEFIGPLHVRSKFAHQFIYDLIGLRTLIAATGATNLGILLDAYHLYTSGGSLADMDGLTNRDIVTVHVNDATLNIPIDEQQDLVRHLPLATGVIDLAGFMGRLSAIGYDGPVTVEPFSKTLEDVAARNAKAAAQITRVSLTELWQAAGIG